MSKKYDELYLEEKEALIELCKEDPAAFIETALGIELLEFQKVYIRKTFEALKKQDKPDWRPQYLGEPYKCKLCNGTGIRGVKKCPACYERRKNDSNN